MLKNWDWIRLQPEFFLIQRCGEVPVPLCFNTLLNEQRRDRVPVRKPSGATGHVMNFRRGIDTKSPENRGRQVRRCDRIACRESAKGIARAIDGAPFDATSRQQDGIAVGPVIPAAIAIDFRRTTELTHRDDQS